MLIENSDEPYAAKIAAEVTRTLRRKEPVETTTQLREVIEKALSFLPANNEKKELIKKTCQRTFQALRIDVNSEFEVLEAFLDKLPDALAGRTEWSKRLLSREKNRAYSVRFPRK